MSCTQPCCYECTKDCVCYSCFCGEHICIRCVNRYDELLKMIKVTCNHCHVIFYSFKTNQ